MQEIIAFGLTKIELIIIFVGFLLVISGVALVIEGLSRRKSPETMLVDAVKQMAAKQSQSDSEWFLGKD
ncbi:hypothetical protein CHUUTOTORO_00670 [Serratia phage vB_SmaM-ChuuTotoro]|nr:hypothetical protein CHUUTOTORO_00670 [Serratia phage vB_SmaM-ChuuTotoro]